MRNGLTQLEEKLLKGESDDFDFQILSSRKDLSALSAYYEQLSDMGETLQQSAAEGREKEIVYYLDYMQIKQEDYILLFKC